MYVQIKWKGINIQTKEKLNGLGERAVQVYRFRELAILDPM